jgi:branched-chain amino acid transport system substrate-binding protein
MATAFFGAKAAYEKAQKLKKGTPTDDDIIAAFERSKFESVAGIVDMSLGKGHQAVQHVPYGTVRMVDGKPTLTNVKYYTPDQISPPDGVKSIDWIRSGFKR